MRDLLKGRKSLLILLCKVAVGCPLDCERDNVLLSCIAGHYGAKFAAPQLRLLLRRDVPAAIEQQSDGFEVTLHPW